MGLHARILGAKRKESDGEPFVRLSEVRDAADDVWELKRPAFKGVGAWLLHKDRNGWHEYVLLEWISEADEGAQCSVLFMADGPGGSLKELRHIRWTPFEEHCGTGYDYYPELGVIAEALVMMGRHIGSETVTPPAEPMTEGPSDAPSS